MRMHHTALCGWSAQLSWAEAVQFPPGSHNGQSGWLHLWWPASHASPRCGCGTFWVLTILGLCSESLPLGIPGGVLCTSWVHVLLIEPTFFYVTPSYFLPTWSLRKLSTKPSGGSRLSDLTLSLFLFNFLSHVCCSLLNTPKICLFLT